MDVWKIQFLGVPTARCGGQEAHLRSKETWAVLASLIVPSTLRGEEATCLARETLADRFWADSVTVDSRTHLRQCLSSLRATFGDPCLIGDRHDVQVSADWYQTDLDLIFHAYRRALAATTPEERLHWLLEAEKEMRGEFFEGWTPDAEEAQFWLVLTRADLRSRLLPILLLLARTLEETGNLVSAFDIVRRVLRFQPGHREARKRAWKLAVATGQQDVMHALEQIQSFREASERLPKQGLNAVTIRDGRLFQSLFEAELKTLSLGLQRAFLKLSILPSPFSSEVAQGVCGVSLAELHSLTKTPFLQQTGEAFALTEIIRDCAWRQLDTNARRRLRKRLALFCVKCMQVGGVTPSVLPASLGTAGQSGPLLLAALEWMMEQKPTSNYVWFIDMVRWCGRNDLALLGVPYLQKAVLDASLPTLLRLQAGAFAAYILMHEDDNAGAIALLEIGLPIAEAFSDLPWLASYYSTLMRAYSNIGAWEMAKQRGRQGEESCRLVGHRLGEVHCIRFQAEILFYSGEPEQALLLCNRAQEQARTLPPESDQWPDALYWKARILARLNRWNEALDAVEEALAHWHQAGDTKKGLCLCVLGQIHIGLGRYAEAQAHLEHSLLLHTRSAREGHRIATVEALGDLYVTLHKPEEAHALYTESLAYHRTKPHRAGITRLEDKLSVVMDLQEGRLDSGKNHAQHGL